MHRPGWRTSRNASWSSLARRRRAAGRPSIARSRIATLSWRSTTSRLSIVAFANDQPESAFATVRHRTIRSKGCLSNKTALAMVFKVVKAAQKRWRRLRGYDQLPKAIQGLKFTGERSSNCKLKLPPDLVRRQDSAIALPASIQAKSLWRRRPHNVWRTSASTYTKRRS